jgi:hypothetical protein
MDAGRVGPPAGPDFDGVSEFGFRTALSSGV